MKKRWIVLALVLVLALVAVAVHHTADYTARSLQRISDIAADVYASYAVIGINEEMMDGIRATLNASPMNDEDIEKFCRKWGMSKEDFDLFRSQSEEYCILEVIVEIDNESDTYLYLSIVCDNQDSFTNEDSFLFCDGPKLPEYTCYRSEASTYILLKKQMLEAFDDPEQPDELKLYCISYPQGFRHQVYMKTRIFPEYKDGTTFYRPVQ